MTAKTTWATAISKNENLGTAIIFRYLQVFDFNKMMLSHQTRVIITWKYDGFKGMPDNVTLQKMDFLEDTLNKYMDDGVFSTLAIVSTGDGLREWTYYTSSEDAFFTRLNDALTESEPYPIQLHSAIDSSWSTYKEFLQTLQPS